MRIRSFIVAYALLLAILLFADRRTTPVQQDRYSHIVDLTGEASGSGRNPAAPASTRIIAPGALIPGTWTAGQIPPERLIAPLVVMDLNVAPPAQISLDDIAAWEARHGAVPQGAVVAIRQSTGRESTVSTPQSGQLPIPLDAAQLEASTRLPIASDAARFLMDARYTLGFTIETAADLNTDRALARQIALHGNYVVESATRLAGIPATGSLIIVAPASEKNSKSAAVRVLAMVR